MISGKHYFLAPNSSGWNQFYVFLLEWEIILGTKQLLSLCMPCCMLVWVTWVQIGCTNDCIKRCGCGIYRTPMIVELGKNEKLIKKQVLEIPTNDSYQPLNHRTEKPFWITKTHAGRRPCAAGPTEQGVPLVPAEILLEGWLDPGRHHCSESLLGNPVAEGRTKSSLRFVAKLLHFFLVVNNIWTSEKSNKNLTPLQLLQL